MDLKNELLGLVSKNDNSSVLDQAESLCPELSYKQRVMGFAAFSGAGWVLSIFSMISLLKVLTDPATFAIIFAISQILNICGVCFLAGPKSQVKGLKNPGKMVATILFFSSIILSLVSAIVLKINWVVVLSVALEMSAYVWYCITLFPFGQKLCKGCLKNLCFEMK